MKTGWSLDHVRGMDVVTFNAVTTIITRLTYREKREDAWVSMIAAQGEKQSMTSITDAWRDAAGEEEQVPNPQTSPQGAMAFLKALKIDPSRGGRF